MPGNGKDSSSSCSNNNSLDEIKALLNEKFNDFSKKLFHRGHVLHHRQRDIHQDGADIKESRRRQS